MVMDTDTLTITARGPLNPPLMLNPLTVTTVMDTDTPVLTDTVTDIPMAVTTTE